MRCRFETEVVLPELIELSASRNLADAVEHISPGIRVEKQLSELQFLTDSDARAAGTVYPDTF